MGMAAAAMKSSSTPLSRSHTARCSMASSGALTRKPKGASHTGLKPARDPRGTAWSVPSLDILPFLTAHMSLPTVVVDVLGGEGLVVRGHAEDLHLDVRVDHLALLGALGLGQLLPADDADLQLDRVGEWACGSKKGEGGYGR